MERSEGRVGKRMEGGSERETASHAPPDECRAYHRRAPLPWGTPWLAVSRSLHLPFASPSPLAGFTSPLETPLAASPPPPPASRRPPSACTAPSPAARTPPASASG